MFFRHMATSVLVVFLGIMVFVTITAYSRRSGSTKQDMAQAQLLRKAALPQQVVEEAP